MTDTDISTQAIKLGLTPADIEIYIKESADNGYYIISKNDQKEEAIQKLRALINNEIKETIEVKQLYKLI